MIAAAFHRADAVGVLLLLVVVGLVVASAVAFWRGLTVAGVALMVLAVIAAVLLL